MIRVHHLDVARIAAAHAGQAPPALVDAMMGFRRDGSQERACAELFEAGFYRLAASLPTGDLERAWEMTNHDAAASGDWTAAARARPASAQERSSMVGDLFEDSRGRFWVVASCGFAPMPDDFGSLREERPRPKL